jgi:hypothetical protein
MKKLVYVTAFGIFILECFNLFVMLFAGAFGNHKLFVINVEIFGTLTFLLIMLAGWTFTFKGLWLSIKEFFHKFDEWLKNLHGDGKLY